MKRFIIFILLTITSFYMFSEELYSSEYSRLIPLGFNVFDTPVDIGEINFVDINDQMKSSHDWLGNVVILKIWRNWDPICEYEMGQFLNYFNSLDTKVLFINDSDSKFSLENFLYWENIKELTYFDNNGDVKALLGSGKGPSTIVLNKEGQIVASSYFNEIDWSSSIIQSTF